MLQVRSKREVNWDSIVENRIKDKHSLFCIKCLPLQLRKNSYILALLTIILIKCKYKYMSLPHKKRHKDSASFRVVWTWDFIF